MYMDKYVTTCLIYLEEVTKTKAIIKSKYFNFTISFVQLCRTTSNFFTVSNYPNFTCRWSHKV